MFNLTQGFSDLNESATFFYKGSEGKYFCLWTKMQDQGYYLDINIRKTNFHKFFIGKIKVEIIITGCCFYRSSGEKKGIDYLLGGRKQLLWWGSKLVFSTKTIAEGSPVNADL